MSLTERKRIWRRTYRASRAARRTTHSDTTVTLNDIKPIIGQVPRTTTIAGYSPLTSEVDVLPLLREWVEGGGVALVPTADALASAGRSAPLWQVFQTFPKGRLGAEPELRALGDTTLILVPGLVFGSDGRRLGRGAGWYDRALSTASPDALLVGVCHDEELIERALVPIEDHDRLVDFVLTPSTLVSCRPTLN